MKWIDNFRLMQRVLFTKCIHFQMIKSIPSCKPNQMKRRDKSGNYLCCYTVICRQGEYIERNTLTRTYIYLEGTRISLN